MADNSASSGRLKYEAGFAREVYGMENGSYLKLCMQCGVCAVSCATFKIMDYSPRRLFALVRAGRKEEVMKSNTFWMCTTCLMCKASCPRGIPIVDVMHDLKGLALKQGYVNYPQAAFYQAFWQDLAGRGRIFEGGVTARYFLKRGPKDFGKIMAQKDVGLKMLSHGRLPLRPPKAVKGKKELMQMVAKARELEQKGAN